MTKARDIASATTPNANAALLATFPHRNLVINGAMQASQRGTSETGVTTISAFVLDRYTISVNDTAEYTISQSTTAPDGFANSMKWDNTTANASPSSGQYSLFAQKIEGQNLQHLQYGTASAQSVTLSFWVRSNKTGTYIAELLQPDASNRHIGKAYTISSADTWEHKTITFPGDTSGVINNDNGHGLSVTWWLGAGSTFTSGTLQTSWGALDQANRAVGNVNLADSTSNEWYITGVQLELGDTSTPFEHRSFGDELARCQRYYYQTLTGAAYQRQGLGVAISTSFVDMPYRLPQTMRTRPSTTKSGSMSVESNTTKSVSAVTISTDSSSADVVRYGITCSTSLTVGYAYYLFNGNDANAYLTFDAEL